MMFTCQEQALHSRLHAISIIRIFELGYFFYHHYSHNVTPLHSINDGLRKSRRVLLAADLIYV